jgi:tetratricopeptide (TPR) repeat protein
MRIKQTALSHFLFFLVLHLSAQPELDSLLTVWEDVTNDSTPAHAFTDYIYDGDFYTNPDSAILLADELLQFTEAANYKRGRIDTLNLSGYIYFSLGKYREAIAPYQRGLKIAEEIDDILGTTDMLKRIGYINHDTGNLVMA